MLVFLYAGSNPLANDYTPSNKTKASYAWDFQKYTALLKQNMENTDKRYSKEYIFYDFIVDTDEGSTLIQNLIDPSAVSFIVDQLEIKNLDYNGQLLKIYDYVLQILLRRPSNILASRNNNSLYESRFYDI